MKVETVRMNYMKPWHSLNFRELYSAIIKYKKEIKELRWENNILREKKKKIGRNTIWMRIEERRMLHIFRNTEL